MLVVKWFFRAAKVKYITQLLSGHIIYNLKPYNLFSSIIIINFVTFMQLKILGSG